MTVDALVSVLQAHLKSRGLTFIDSATGIRLVGIDEAAVALEIATLVADLVPVPWDEEITKEIPIDELYDLRAEAAEAA